MPVLNAGANVTLSLSTATAYVSVRVPTGGALTFEYPVGTVIDVTAASKTYGPYTSGSCKITATSRDVEYSQAAFPAMGAQVIVSAAAPDNNDGRPDGTVYVQSAS